jgi:hypothetical protein
LRNHARNKYEKGIKTLSSTKEKLSGKKAQEVLNLIEEQAKEKIAQMESIVLHLEKEVVNTTAQTAFLTEMLRVNSGEEW